MSDRFWWYLARSSGLVAWALLAAAVLWGLFLSTRILQAKRRPAWLLDLHRWLGGLAVIFTGFHLLGLSLDSYVEFRVRDFFVPFSSRWHPAAVAWGVVGLYLLLAVQGTSLLMKKLPRRLWRGVHLTSFGLFWVASMHAAAAGTDVATPWYRWASTSIITSVLVAVAYRVFTKGPAARRSGRRMPAAA